MKQRVADFIADFIADNGITQVFSVVGGGAMHLNNAFGISERLSVMYNHHEQASAIAAESYSRINNQMAAVCVTSGPGGTNALTGVLCAYQDNLPLIVISGQVRQDITVESTGLHLRQYGEQEYHIVKSVEHMTKYAIMLTDANMIKYHLGKAIHLAQSGRQGPCWIDVPLNIQGQIIDISNLIEFVPEEKNNLNSNLINAIIHEIQQSRCPVIVAGSSVRTSGCLDSFYNLVDRLKLPVVCPTSTVDIMAVDDELYFGMFGVFGGRVGNFIVQNADLIISLGARLSFKQIGFNCKEFAPNARKIVVDIDPDELKKPTINIDIPICADVADVVDELCKRELSCNLGIKENWLNYCIHLKRKLDIPRVNHSSSISAYQFSDIFLDKQSKNALVVLGNNCAAVSVMQNGVRIRGQRMYGNVNCGTMGYDLPGAIGAAVASGETVFCLTGDGSIQMNIQELQTIVHNNLPIKIIVFNNFSYQAIVNTQTNFFDGVLSGCTRDSGLSFPSFEKLASAYEYPFLSISKSDEISSAVDWLHAVNGRAMLEIIQTQSDPIEPKLSSKKTKDGSIISPPIDDMYPFLSKSEYDECQFSSYKGGL